MKETKRDVRCDIPTAVLPVQRMKETKRDVRVMTQPALRKTTLWRHQLEAYHHSFTRPASLLGMAMGTGKSAVAISLAQNWGCHDVLIICPKSVMQVWPREMQKHCYHLDYRVMVLDKGSVKQKATNMGAFLVSSHGAPMRVAILNYESAWREDLAKALLGRKWDLVVLDESHRAKSSSSKISKFCWKLSRVAARRLCLTGTPMPHGPLDVFGQVRFLDDTIFGPSWHKFRYQYASYKQVPGVAVPILIGYQNVEDLEDRLKPIMYQVGADVLDLPPATHQEIPVILSTRGQRVYNDLERDFVASVGDGTVTASNALVKLLRLQQTTSGTIKLEDGREETVCTAKREALKEILEDLPVDEKVVVFCRFVHDLRVTSEVAEELGRPYGELSGSVNGLAEGATLPDTPGLVFGVQIQSGGVGVDLSRAAYAVYVSVGYSLGEFLQSAARLHRPGQTRPVHYYHLVARGTVDEKVYAALEEKREIVDTILQEIKHDAHYLAGADA